MLPTKRFKRHSPLPQHPDELQSDRPSFIQSHSNVHIRIKRQGKKPPEPEQPLIRPPSKAALMSGR